MKIENKILITGAAGFIGFHLVSKLLSVGNYEIIGLDNLNEYYDVTLKFGRLEQHGISAKNSIDNEILYSSKFNNYKFYRADIAEHDIIIKLFIDQKFDYVINLAAQAGVRYSIDNPRAYTHSNIDGFLSILEGCRISNVKHLLFASTSSVYGLNSKLPFFEKHPTQHPISLYSATKKANELMAHTYSHLFRLPSTGLRFFTVYGPWGRPDMALFLLANSIIGGKEFRVFNHGEMLRDFTYVDDIVEALFRLIPKPPTYNKDWDSLEPSGDSSSAPFKIFNVGNGKPVHLKECIMLMEQYLGKKANLIYTEIQAGDVPATMADIRQLEDYIDFRPQTEIDFGIKKFIDWYKSFYSISL
jgi:UDP-glucuronate 4-epimerase